MSWLLGFAETEWLYRSDSVKLPLKQKKDSKSTGSATEVPLGEFCKSVTPPCHLSPLYFNGHLRTIGAVLANNPVNIYYRRRIFSSEDEHYPGTFVVDFVHHPFAEKTGELDPELVQKESDPTLFPRTRFFSDDEWAGFPSDDETPMLVALHGISGGSQELYLREAIKPLVLPNDPAKQRWECCIVTARACGKSKLTSERIFNARATWDLRQVVKWLRKAFPNRPLFACGFSLGANILTNYLGEEGDQCEFNAAMALSNPWNLEAGGLALKRTWIGLEVYSKTLAKNMKKLVKHNEEEIAKIPGIDMDAIRNSRYLHEFDQALQCPSWGYPTVNAYYRDASSTDPLLNVKIPLFTVHALDDPVTAEECLPREEVRQNSYATLCTTSLGGHLGWIEIGGGRWFVKPVEGFFRKFVEEVDLSKLRTQKQSNGVKVPSATKPAYNPLTRKLDIQVF